MKRFFAPSLIGLITLSILVGGFITPHVAQARSSGTLEVSGWLPYWKGAAATTDVSGHTNQLSEINPFGYTVRLDGTLYDAFGATSTPWQNLFQGARRSGTRIVPTVMWSDTANIAKILGNSSLRATHESAIVAMVKNNNFDGVDIDYEGKTVATKDSYSIFLKELKSKLGSKELSCTIEARTPPDSLNTTASLSSIEYSNDYTKIGTYCDKVKLMTYDQQNIDKKLNAVASSTKSVYTPVSDTAWVTKVVQLATQSIPKNKISIGVATYGYEYLITAVNGRYTYKLLNSFNPAYAINLAQTLGITPERNSAGELSFSYVATTSAQILASIKAPSGTSSAQLASARALVASTASSTSFRYVDWSDATAIQSKIQLAAQLGVNGISVFKFDGSEDPNIWPQLPRIH